MVTEPFDNNKCVLPGTSCGIILATSKYLNCAT